MVGAVLVQRTAWANAARAIDSLRRTGLLAPGRMRAEPFDALAGHIRASGFFRTKARKLHALCAYLEGYGDDVARMRAAGAVRLRSELLAVHGIGPETADAIMLYGRRNPHVRGRRLCSPHLLTARRNRLQKEATPDSSGG